jgi:hypothetical protein
MGRIRHTHEQIAAALRQSWPNSKFAVGGILSAPTVQPPAPCDPRMRIPGLTFRGRRCPRFVTACRTRHTRRSGYPRRSVLPTTCQ